MVNTLKGFFIMRFILILFAIFPTLLLVPTLLSVKTSPATIIGNIQIDRYPNNELILPNTKDPIDPPKDGPRQPSEPSELEQSTPNSGMSSGLQQPSYCWVSEHKGFCKVICPNMSIRYIKPNTLTIGGVNHAIYPQTKESACDDNILKQEQSDIIDTIIGILKYPELFGEEKII